MYISRAAVNNIFACLTKGKSKDDIEFTKSIIAKYTGYEPVHNPSMAYKYVAANKVTSRDIVPHKAAVLYTTDYEFLKGKFYYVIGVRHNDRSPIHDCFLIEMDGELDKNNRHRLYDALERELGHVDGVEYRTVKSRRVRSTGYLEKPRTYFGVRRDYEKLFYTANGVLK